MGDDEVSDGRLDFFVYYNRSQTCMAWQSFILIHRAEDIEASPLLDLEVIKIVSDCNEEYVSFILGAVMSSHFDEDT